MTQSGGKFIGKHYLVRPQERKIYRFYKMYISTRASKATVQLFIWLSQTRIGHAIVVGYTNYPGTNKTGEASL